MSRTLTPADVPPATRAQPPGWRDPRLWVGVAIVAASVVAGARLLGSADDTVTVWAAARELAPGAELTEADLESHRVRFDDPGDLSRYLATGDPLPADPHLLRGLGGGELVPASALGTAEDTGVVTVSLSFPVEEVPSGVSTGSRVDVWVVADDAPASKRRGSAEAVLDDVVVVDAPARADTLGSVGTVRALVLGIPREEPDALAEILAASPDGRVRVLGRG